MEQKMMRMKAEENVKSCWTRPERVVGLGAPFPPTMNFRPHQANLLACDYSL